MGQVIYIDPVALRKPVQYDHGHFLNSDGRCVLCQVRSLAEVRNQRLTDELSKWFDSEIGQP